MLEKIKTIAERYQNTKDQIQTEEAAKTALVLPFIAALGYEIFNPLEVIPEFTADIGSKKGEKIDYAIKQNDQLAILVECKKCDDFAHDKNVSQLFRYFTACDAHLALLTNGIEYHFFADVDKTNKMDEAPFFSFNILNFDDHQLSELKRFAKQDFDINNILSTANDMKYRASIKVKLAEYLKEPSANFVRGLVSDLNFPARLTQQVLAYFTVITKEAFNQFIRERVGDRLKSALQDNQEAKADITQLADQMQFVDQVDAEAETSADGIVTTQDEIDGYTIIKSILRETTSVKRIVMRDAKSYCAVLLDDNNRKPICRMYFNNPARKRLAIFSNKQESFVTIEDLDDIYQHAERLKETVKEYEALKQPVAAAQSETESIDK